MMVKSEPLSANYLAQKRRRKQRKVMLGQEKFASSRSRIWLVKKGKGNDFISFIRSGQLNVRDVLAGQ